MIRNERQYQTTKEKLLFLKETLKKRPKSNSPENVTTAALAQISELVSELETEIKDYELLKSLPHHSEMTFSSIDDLKLAPIRYRISRKMTVDAFARLVGINARQIIRYENDQYNSMSLERLKELLDKLDLQIQGKLKAK